MTMIHLSRVLFLPVANIFLASWSCVYDGNGRFVLSNEPSVQCWSGRHPFYASAALLCLLHWIPTSLVISPAFLEPTSPLTPAYKIRFAPASAIVESMMDFLVALFANFQQGASLAGTAFVALVLFVYNLTRDKEKELFCVNLLREAFFVITFWLSACEFSLARLPSNLHDPIRALFFYGFLLVVVYCVASLHRTTYPKCWGKPWSTATALGSGYGVTLAICTLSDHMVAVCSRIGSHLLGSCWSVNGDAACSV